MNKIKGAMDIIDAVKFVLDETPEERIERLREAKEEAQRDKEERRVDRPDWDMNEKDYL